MKNETKVFIGIGTIALIALIIILKKKSTPVVKAAATPLPSSTPTSSGSVGVSTDSSSGTASGMSMAMYPPVPVSSSTTTTSNSTTSTPVSLAVGSNNLSAYNNVSQGGLLTFYIIAGATLTYGTVVYSDAACTVPIYAGYYSDGTNCYLVASGGAITAVVPVSSVVATSAPASSGTTQVTPNTQTSNSTPVSLAYNPSNPSVAASAALAGSSINYYTQSGVAFGTGSGIYSDAALTSPAPSGMYSNGTNWYQVLNGMVTDTELCSSLPTPTTPTSSGGTGVVATPFIPPTVTPAVTNPTIPAITTPTKANPLGYSLAVQFDGQDVFEPRPNEVMPGYDHVGFN